MPLDVSTRGDVLGEPERRRLFFPYPGTRAVTARWLTVEEAFAEMLRALSTRSLGRDRYDCWFPLEAGLDVDPALFERKMVVLGERARVTITVTERDLSVLVEHPPGSGAAVRAVSAAAAGAGPGARPTLDPRDGLEVGPVVREPGERNDPVRDLVGPIRVVGHHQYADPPMASVGPCQFGLDPGSIADRLGPTDGRRERQYGS